MEEQEFLFISHWSAPADQVGLFGHVIYRYQAIAMFGVLAVCMVSAYFATLRAFQRQFGWTVRWASLPLVLVGLAFAFFNWGWFHRPNARGPGLKEMGVSSAEAGSPISKDQNPSR